MQWKHVDNSFRNHLCPITSTWLVVSVISTSGEVSFPTLYLENVGRPSHFKDKSCVSRAIAHFLCLTFYIADVLSQCFREMVSITALVFLLG